jgi:Tol biopolymer transport system component
MKSLSFYAVLIALLFLGADFARAVPGAEPGVGGSPAEPMGKIAFQRSTFNDDPRVWADDTEIFVMDADGANKRNVTNNPARDYFGSFNPDGTRIVFTSNRDTGVRGAQEIFVMDSDGSNVEPLGIVGQDPVWSPDGEFIVFVVPGTTTLFIMRSDGTESRLLSRGRGGIVGGYPSWSPDGKQLAFIDGQGVSVVSVDSGNPVHLTDFAEPRRPVWTPDGQRIVFYRHFDPQVNGADHVFVVDLEDLNVERYMREHNVRSVYEFAFTRDGLVVFQGSIRTAYALWLMDLENGASTSLPGGSGFLGVTGNFSSLLLSDGGGSPRAVSPREKLTTTWATIKGVD